MHRYSGLDATGEDGEAEQLSPSQSRASSRGRPLPGCQGGRGLLAAGPGLPSGLSLAAAAVPHRSGLAAAAAAPAARYASGPPGLSRPWPPAGGKPAAPRHQKGITGLAGGRRAPPDCAGLGLEKAQKRRECGQRSGCARNALGVEEQGGGSARYQRLNSPQLRRMGGRGAGCKGAGRATCVAAAAGGAEPRSAAPLHPRNSQRAAPGAGATAPAPRNPPAGRDSPLSGTAPHSAPLGSPGPPSIELAGLPSLRKLG
ncbi:spidroin-1-like [Sarcophilus harrisii]|uniref:spidroin-1-like n=1 Tax=Sarcophilus harrisii TaxID=9305 RepID=UPI001301DFBC|nr:spidroin-1-like [Sarcophilus harrisii]